MSRNREGQKGAKEIIGLEEEEMKKREALELRAILKC